MLSYWILRDRNELPIGLVKCENDSVSLKLNGTHPADWMLFSDSDAVPIEPDAAAALCGANAVLGMSDGRIVGFAAGPGAQTVSAYLARMSHLCTIATQPPTPVAPEPPLVEVPSAPSAAPMQTLADPVQDPEPVEPEPPEDPDVSASEPAVETADGSAERTAQFSLLLSHADAFFRQFEQPAIAETLVQKEDIETKGGIDLFPQAFPNARWRYVDGTNILPHYEGLVTGKSGERTRIHAVRGRAAPRPPRTLPGFTRYLFGSDGNGYWVRTE